MLERAGAPDQGVLRVCVVCAGNICRSPMAEVVLKAMLSAAGFANQVVVDSAGTGAWNLGSPASQGAQSALARRGYRAVHVARQFNPSWFAERDLVLALDAQNAADLRRLAPDAAARAKVRMLGAYADQGSRASDEGPIDDAAVAVPDPYGGSDADFDRAFGLIEAACAGFVARLRAVGPAALPVAPPPAADGQSDAGSDVRRAT